MLTLDYQIDCVYKGLAMFSMIVMITSRSRSIRRSAIGGGYKRPIGCCFESKGSVSFLHRFSPFSLFFSKAFVFLLLRFSAFSVSFFFFLINWRERRPYILLSLPNSHTRALRAGL